RPLPGGGVDHREYRVEVLAVRPVGQHAQPQGGLVPDASAGQDCLAGGVDVPEPPAVLLHTSRRASGPRTRPLNHTNYAGYQWSGLKSAQMVLRTQTLVTN